MFPKSVKNSMFPNTTHAALILFIPPTFAKPAGGNRATVKTKCDGPVSATVWGKREVSPWALCNHAKEEMGGRPPVALQP